MPIEIFTFFMPNIIMTLCSAEIKTPTELLNINVAKTITKSSINYNQQKLSTRFFQHQIDHERQHLLHYKVTNPCIIRQFSRVANKYEKYK